MPHRSSLLLALLPTCLVAACESGSTEPEPEPCDPGTIASVTIQPAIQTIEQGQSIDLTAALVDECGDPSTSVVTWASSAPAVLDVSPAGRVTGLAVGAAEVIATAAGGGAHHNLAVDVLRTPLVFAAPETLSVRTAGTGTVAAVVTDYSGAPMPEVVVSWQSSNADIATVDEAGVVTGQTMGTAVVRATVAGQSHVPDSVVVIVGPPLPSPVDAAAHLAAVAASLAAGTAPSPALRAIELAGGITAPLAQDPPLDTAAVPCNYHYESQIFRDASFGVTYVWDADQAAYVASDEPGAPDCGLRLIVYAIDDATGQPSLPLARIGYVEGRDAGSFWGNPRHTSLGVQIVSVDGAGTETTVASWISRSVQEYFSRATVTTGELSGWMEQQPGARFEFQVSEERHFSYSPGASYDFVIGTRRYELGDALVTVDREFTTATVNASIGGTRVRIELTSTTTDSWYEAGEVSAAGGFAELGTVATARGPFANLSFFDVDGGALNAGVDAQLEGFWSSLVAHFGVADWPTL